MTVTQSYKRIWFVVLMAFAIGWSAVSYAFSQPMHALMENTMDQSAHCVQMTDSVVHGQDHGENEQIAHHDHMYAKQAMAQLDHCQSSETHASSTMQGCNDCSALYCQVGNLAVIQQDIIFSQPIITPTINPLLGFYQAQHLVGFHQRILRPPRA